MNLMAVIQDRTIIVYISISLFTKFVNIGTRYILKWNVVIDQMMMPVKTFIHICLKWGNESFEMCNLERESNDIKFNFHYSIYLLCTWYFSYYFTHIFPSRNVYNYTSICKTYFIYVYVSLFAFEMRTHSHTHAHTHIHIHLHFETAYIQEAIK